MISDSFSLHAGFGYSTSPEIDVQTTIEPAKYNVGFFILVIGTDDSYYYIIVISCYGIGVCATYAMNPRDLKVCPAIHTTVM